MERNPRAKTRSITHTLNAAERGLTYPLFAILSASLIAVLAMVIDHSRQSLSFEMLQRTADAAALSGARRLDGRLQGWSDSKKAAIVALKQNSIHGVSSESLGAIRLNRGPSAFPEALSAHPGSEGTAGRLQVQVERGILWYDSTLSRPKSGVQTIAENGGYRFISLEDPNTDSPIPLPVGAEAYLYSNAVRVTLTLDSLSTSIGRILGMSEFANLKRSAIAVSHEELEVPVAPFAIPLCALRLNADPFAPADSTESAEVDLSSSCTRQGLATEADPKRELSAVAGERLPLRSADDIERRREGLARAEALFRPFYAMFDPVHGLSTCHADPVTGARHNCKSLPLFAVLGVPAEEPGHAATAEQVANAFVEQPIARPGMYFSPLLDLKDFAINANLDDRIARSFSEPSADSRHSSVTTFMDAFTEANSLSPNGRVAKRNFPAIRNERPSCGNPGSADDAFDPERRPCIEDDPHTPTNEFALNHRYDLRIDWPTPYSVGGKPIEGQLLMDGRREDNTRVPLDYTNPMCHHPSLPIDALNEGDPARHKVKRMLVPVIAPGAKTRPNEKPVSYCNWEEVFNAYSGQPRASSVAPSPASLPLIIGFIPAYVYDLNLDDLDRNTAFLAPGAYQPLELNDEDTIVPPNSWRRVATPTYTDPSTGRTLTDNNPAFLSVGYSIVQQASHNALQFMEDHDEWEGCINEAETERDIERCEEKRPEPVGGSYLGIPAEYRQCFDFSGIFSHEEFGNVVQAISEITPGMCTRRVEHPDGSVEEQRYVCMSKGEAERDAFFKILGDFFTTEIPALPHTHCFPRENLNDGLSIKDKNDPRYYIQPLDTTRAGFGCGGVLFKTACDVGNSNKIVLSAGIAWDTTTPALVAEDTAHE